MYGRGGDDVLYGAANARLYGDAGDDLLIAQGGGNRLTGGAGRDILRLETSLNQLAEGGVQPDVITDFKPGEDQLHLDNSIFSRLSAGVLSAAHFRANTTGAAESGADYLLYNVATGALLYDADGDGAGAAIQFATLSNKPKDLSAADLFVAV